MPLLGRLGFAIRKLIFDLLGITIDQSIPSAEVAAQFATSLGEFDVAMSTKSSLLTVLAYAEGSSPDATVQAAIDQIQTDLQLSPTP
ncbi:hypothetical protein [Nonomuraea sp. NPDC049400]|uniref:hypothetical protein n=1 Tax=Nonomuraea sp. NPDC049400 TaxID=3364352 RepID=UPI00378E77B0